MTTFKEYFYESPAFDDSSKVLGSTPRTGAEDYRHVHNGKSSLFKYHKILEIPFKDNIVIQMFEKKRDYMINAYVFALTGEYYENEFQYEQVIGSIETDSMHIGDKMVMRVRTSQVLNEYQGKGIGFKLYTILLDHYKALVSDNLLTGETGFGSFDVWRKLSSLGKCYIYNTTTKKLRQVDSFHREDMKSKDEHFVIMKS